MQQQKNQATKMHKMAHQLKCGRVGKKVLFLYIVRCLYMVYMMYAELLMESMLVPGGF